MQAHITQISIYLQNIGNRNIVIESSASGIPLHQGSRYLVPCSFFQTTEETRDGGYNFADWQGTKK